MSKFYETFEGRVCVLDNISVDFPAGENVGILGFHGVGKSTLLRLMSGLDEPDNGSVQRYGTVSWPLGSKSAHRKKLSGRENATLLGHIRGLRARKLKGFVKRVEDFCELGEHYSTPISHYTSEMCSKFNFGLSMASNFNTYLIDDMLTVGDLNFRRKCAVAVEEKARYSDLIIASSNINVLKKYCTRGAYLSPKGLEVFPNLDHAIQRYRRSLH